MTKLAVQKVAKPELAPSLFKSMDAMLQNVRRRAFELFKKRGAVHGSDLDDWFQAEQDLIYMPKMELVENDQEFQIKVSLPDFESKDIKVWALRSAVIIEGAHGHRKETKGDDFQISESSEKTLFRSLELPQAIDIEKVEANFKDGVLEVVAAKQVAPQKMQVAAAA